MSELSPAEAAQELHQELCGKPGYQNIGVGRERLVVYVRPRSKFLFKYLGKTWRGYPIQIEVLGTVRALQTAANR